MVYCLISTARNAKKNAINALHETVRQAIENVKDLVRNLAATSYDQINEQILSGEESLKMLTQRIFVFDGNGRDFVAGGDGELQRYLPR